MLVIPQGALKALVRMLGNPKAIFVRPSDGLHRLAWRRLPHEFSLRKLAHLQRQNNVAHHVVNLGIRAVH